MIHKCPQCGVEQKDLLLRPYSELWITMDIDRMIVEIWCPEETCLYQSLHRGKVKISQISIDYGKHKGSRLIDLSKDYLQWLYETTEDELFKKVIKKI